MNPKHIPATLSLLFVAAAAASAQTSITIGEAAPRSNFFQHFYGSNGQDRGDFDWNTAGFPAALAGLNLGYLRFPCGTGANYWQWDDGEFLTMYQATTAVPADLNELRKEIQSSGTAIPIFVLNLISDSNPISKTYNHLVPGGPSTGSKAGDFQLNASTGIMNISAHGGGSGLGNQTVPIACFELGNEVYGGGDNTTVYPTATGYGTLMNSWLDSIHAQGSYQVAAVAADRSLKPTVPRRQQWNWGSPPNYNTGLFQTLNLAKADAVTIHIYPEPNLVDDAMPPIDGQQGGKAQQLFGSVFINWQAMQNDDFGTIQNQGMPTGIPIWITEYNLDSQYQSATANAVESAYYGTWAHGLTLGAMSLKWLDQWTVQMLIHHDTVSSAAYGDIFSDNNGLSVVSYNKWKNGVAPSTTPNGLSASGIVTSYINTAAIGMTGANKLTFSGFGSGSGSSYPVTNNFPDGTTISVPRLYGWEFTAANGKDQAVIINFDSVSYSLDFSSVLATGTKAVTYQAYGDPSYYVTNGKATATSDAVDDTGTAKTISYEHTTGTTSFVVQPFSITRVTYTHR